MDGLRIGDVARPLAPLTPDDTLARAAELLRSLPFDALPVVADGRLVGVVTERAVGEAAEAMLRGVIPPEEGWLMALGNGLITPAAPLPASGALQDAVAVFPQGVRSLPVTDGAGRYLGMVQLADLASAVCQAQRPPSIGGMATPLGVYLTTGALSAGARGSLGLFLTGVAIGTGVLLAYALTGLLVLAVERWVGIPVRASLESPPIGILDLNRFDVWPHLLAVLGFVFFGGLLRLSPLAGYHAAEHQVVHAIERDRPLTMENVADMPRAHPRCGTRLLAVGVLVALVWLVLPVSDFSRVLPMHDAMARSLLTVLAVLVWWRTLGTQLQNWVTTKPASQRQIRNAIAVAEELLARHRGGARRPAGFLRRVWCMGLVQVAAGSCPVVYAGLDWITRHGLVWS